jgi:nucleosome binding factor SPN SPT16 subunit
MKRVFSFVLFISNQCFQKVKHSKLSEGLEAALNDEKFVSNTDVNYVEMCYPAIVQSGGNYNLKFSANV